MIAEPEHVSFFTVKYTTRDGALRIYKYARPAKTDRKVPCTRIPMQTRRNIAAMGREIGPKEAGYIYTIHPSTVRKYMRTFKNEQTD